MNNQSSRCVAMGLSIGLSLMASAQQFAQAPVSQDEVRTISITQESLEALADENWEGRRKAARSLSEEHKKLVDSLVRIIETNDEEKRPEARADAARLLGEWQAISAIPALMRHLDYEVVAVRQDLSEFEFEVFPCAAAIAEMGPTALRPTLAELARRETGLTDKEVVIAAYLTVALCEDSKQGAIDALLSAEYKFDDSLALVRTRTYIENSMGNSKSWPRKHPDHGRNK